MPDITMCCNKNCKKRKSCYRFIAKPNELYQAYFEPKENECEYYLEYKPESHEEKE